MPITQRKQAPVPSLLLPSVTLLAALLLTGCSEKTSFHFGLVTTEIFGKIELIPKDSTEKLFILVQKYNRTFLESTKSSLFRQSVKIIHPDKKGCFRIDMEAQVDRLDLIFVARGFEYGVATFRRSIGIGSIEYKTQLHKDTQWRNTFILKLRPLLAGYVVEEQYKMPPHDQLFLGDWINNTEDLIY